MAAVINRQLVGKTHGLCSPLALNINKQLFPMDRFTCVDSTNNKLLKFSLESDLFVVTSTATVFSSLKEKNNQMEELHKAKAENAIDLAFC